MSQRKREKNGASFAAESTKASGPETPIDPRSVRVRRWIDVRFAVILLALTALWCIPRVAYYRDVVDNELSLFNEWPDSDNAFSIEWAGLIAKGDVLSKSGPHPFHQWHEAMANAWFEKHPERKAEIRGTLPADASDRDVAVALWRRWYGDVRLHQEPLYPYLLAACHIVSSDPIMLMWGLQSIAGLLIGILLVDLARRMFGGIEAVIAGVSYTLCTFVMFHEQTILRTTFITLATLLMAREGFLLTRHSSRAGWVRFGLWCGLAVLLQSACVLYPFLFAVWWIWDKRRDSLAERIRGPAISAAVMGLLLLPVFVRNVAVGAPTTSLSSVGATAFISTQHVSYNAYAGWTIAHETGDLIDMATSRPGAAYVAAVGSHPSIGSWIEQFGKKLKGAFHGVEWSSNENFYNMRALAPSLRFGMLDMFTLIPLGLVGLWIATRRKTHHAPVALGLLFHFVLLVGICVAGRYRVPIAPLLIVYAAGVVGTLLSPVIDGRFPDIVLVVACTIALVAGRSVLNHRPEDEYRVAEFVLLYESKYVPRLNEAKDRKDWDTCTVVLEKFVGFTRDTFLRPDDASGPSRRTKTTMGFFGDTHQRLSELYEMTGRQSDARRAKTTATALKAAAKRL